jgi:hypothetical protein
MIFPFSYRFPEAISMDPIWVFHMVCRQPMASSVDGEQEAMAFPLLGWFFFGYIPIQK